MAMLPDRERIIAGMDLPGEPARTRVVVAMSGGVDSSVAAGLLKHAGYDVVGVTLQLYDHGEAIHRPGSCCSGQDIHDARQVSELIGIPHYVLDYEDRFRSMVIDEFAESYMSGETPIPCVSCNQKIKFNDMLATARELGAAALATGHYISSRRGPKGWELYRPEDASRDQSYFLFATTREQLDFLRFPLGDFNKTETREFAEALGLPVAEKADSQDICFVPTGHYTEVLERLRPDAAEPGDIVHVDGRVLGAHAGIINFTVGQRRGIGVATGEPLYVIRLDAARRQVVVGPREALSTARLWLRDVNWLGDAPLEEAAADGLEVFARVRSTRPPQPAIIHAGAKAGTGAGAGAGAGEGANEGNGILRVDLVQGDDGVSPGQACVFYDSAEPHARVLGGGWIRSTLAGGAVPRARAEQEAETDGERRSAVRAAE
jgi:tRNA-specific 2-thiouridylase